MQGILELDPGSKLDNLPLTLPALFAEGTGLNGGKGAGEFGDCSMLKSREESSKVGESTDMKELSLSD